MAGRSVAAFGLLVWGFEGGAAPSPVTVCVAHWVNCSCPLTCSAGALLWFPDRSLVSSRACVRQSLSVLRIPRRRPPGPSRIPALSVDVLPRSTSVASPAGSLPQKVSLAGRPLTAASAGRRTVYFLGRLATLADGQADRARAHPPTVSGVVEDEGGQVDLKAGGGMTPALWVAVIVAAFTVIGSVWASTYNNRKAAERVAQEANRGQEGRSVSHVHEGSPGCHGGCEERTGSES